MSDIQFEPSALRRAAGGMDEAVQDLLAKTQALMGEVGDVSALGTNDTLGGVASMLYSAVLARVQETVDSVAEEYGAHSQRLGAAAELYSATEDAAVQASDAILGG
ncbi:MAG: hypothetical protein Q4G45_10390 [Actinomycetia bacterium]|nr:hypothetical protein [Actinomycetes bacterium]